jgi:hypothetical protein
MALRGSFQVLMLYDVADGICLDELRRILGLGGPERLPQFIHPAPDYVRFEHPPVVQSLHAFESGESTPCDVHAKYYDYSAISIAFVLRFECNWKSPVERATPIDAPGVESPCKELVRSRFEVVSPALMNSCDDWLNEEYYIVQLREAEGADGRPTAAEDISTYHSAEIAQIVRGESAALSDSERQEVLECRVLYEFTSTGPDNQPRPRRGTGATLARAAGLPNSSHGSAVSLEGHQL